VKIKQQTNNEFIDSFLFSREANANVIGTGNKYIYANEVSDVIGFANIEVKEFAKGL
jgi:hypothetical protein